MTHEAIDGLTAQECIEIAAAVVFQAGYGLDSFLAVVRDAWTTVASEGVHNDQQSAPNQGVHTDSSEATS